MILPLSTLCLLALRDGLRDRPHPYLHLIPSKEQRQQLLNFVLLSNGIIPQRNAWSSLSSLGFLQDFRSLDFQHGAARDGNFLDAVAKSLGEVRPGGDTIGDGVTEAKLNCGLVEVNGTFVTWNLGDVIQLVGKCKNLKQLDLAFKLIPDNASDEESNQIEEYVEDSDMEISNSNDDPISDVDTDPIGEDSNGDIDTAPIRDIDQVSDTDPISDSATDQRIPEAESRGRIDSESLQNQERYGLLNDIDSTKDWVHAMESLEELSVVPPLNHMLGALLIDDRPIIPFRNLSSLHLARSTVDIGAWTEFMIVVQSTLIKLRVEAVKVLPESDANCVLPFPMPKLESFEMDSETRRSRSLFTNLGRCQNLVTVKVVLVARRENEELMRMLSSIEVDVSVEIVLLLHEAVPLESNLDTESRFKLIELFREKVITVSFVCQQWHARYLLALDHLVEVCQNLSKILFYAGDTLESDPTIDFDPAFHRQWQAINSTLRPLLIDPIRSSKLRWLKLIGDIDHLVLTSLFENCTDLNHLYVSFCPSLFDDHLISWAASGARPKGLALIGCDRVSDQGLIPIIQGSGSRLEMFIASDTPRITHLTWFTLMECCKYLRMANVPGAIRDIFKIKCFRGDIDFLS